MALAKDILVRTLNLADSPEVARLSGQLGYPVAEAAVRERLGRMLASPTHAAWAAVRDGKILGWLAAEIRVTIETEPRVEITGLVVDEAARRTGIGQLLVAQAEQWALQHGYDTVLVRSQVIRAESHPFYQGLGYERIKTQHVYKKRVRDM